MNVYINNTSYQIIGDLTVSKYNQKTLDSGMFYLRGNIDLSKYTKVSYTNFNQMVWQTQYLSESNKTQVTTIEWTKILEELVISGFAYSKILTGSAMFNNIVAKLNQRIVYTDYVLNTSMIDNTLFSGNGTEIVIDGSHNIREILDYFLETFGLEIRVQSCENKVLYLKLDNPNFDIDTATEVEYVTPYVSDIKGDEVVDNLATDLSNVVVDEEIKEAPLQIVSESSEFSTDNGIVKTTQPIYKMNKCDMVLKSLADSSESTVALRIAYYSSESATVPSIASILIKTDTLFHVNINDYVVDKEEWDVLSHDQKVPRFYFNRGNNKIEHITNNVRYANGLFDTQPYAQILTILNNNYTDYEGTIDYEPAVYIYDNLDSNSLAYFQAQMNNLGWYPRTDLYGTRGFLLRGVELATSWTLFYLQPTYTTQTGIFIKVGDNGTSLIDNQTASQINEDRFVDSQNSKLRRIGNKEITIDSNGSDYYSVGDYFDIGSDRFILDELQIGISDNNIKQHYHFSKDYNFLNIKQGLSKELRLYSIATEGYVKASIEQAVNADLSSYKGAVIQVNVPQIDSSTTYVQKYIWLPLTKVMNSYVIHFQDNYSAIKYRYVAYTDIYTSLDCAYCNTSTGEQTNKVIYLTSETPSSYTSDGYPCVSLNQFTDLKYFTMIQEKDMLEQWEIILYRASNGKSLNNI